MNTYSLKVALRGISPMIWRRLRVAGTTSLAELHHIIQIAMGWQDDYLHHFHIYGVDHGIHKPERRLLKMLRNQGLQDNQQISFLSDGADNVRDLQQLMHPEADHILDWFHLTMRLTVLNQFAKGVCHSDPEEGAELLKMLESAKWYLWHGNVEQALEELNDCYALADDPEIKYSKSRKLGRHLDDMIGYVHNNAYLIPNYGEKYRYGGAITTAFVESTVNEVVVKRMVKKQQMQWSQIGAHSLLQTRTAVLNGELRGHFEEWYPELRAESQNVAYEEPVKLAA